MKEEEFANRRVLPPDHPVTRQVKAIGLEIVKSALEGKGGGYQNHMQVISNSSFQTHSQLE